MFRANSPRSLALIVVLLLTVSPLPAADGEAVGHLVQQLGSDTFREREAASAALDRLGASALPALREAARSPDLEVRRRAVELVHDIETRIEVRERTEAIRVLSAGVARLGGRCKAGVDAAGLPALTVDFADTAVTDADLASLRGWGAVRELNLSRTKITDEGLKCLRVASSLEVLQLADVRITDRGLEHLMGLTNLGQLILNSTDVTGEGCQRLCKALPHAVILAPTPTSNFHIGFTR